jgi:hypothetical protein
MVTKSFTEEESSADDPLREHTIDIGPGELQRRMSEVAHMAAEAAINRIPLPPNSGRITQESGVWVRWAVGMSVIALIAAAGDYISSTRTLAAMQQGQSDMRAQVAQIYLWMAPRYTGNH